ncbi:MAG TPA: ABC transporter permease subunit [Clostridiaceae bacterium]|nr:ABC transporter permease subunit [Clostridiaceae bacterium]
MNAAQNAVIRKDIREIMSSKQTLIPMIILPVIFTVVLPIGLLFGAQFGMEGVNGMDQLIEIFGEMFGTYDDSQLLIEIAMNYMFPIFFLLIPVMTSSIIGAGSFIGEKERKTMESLLYTPISIKELFIAKVVGVAIPAYAITFISAMMFGIIMNVGGWIYFGRMIFPNLKWILLILWVCPAVTLLGLSFMVLVSAKAQTFQDAQQMSALIIVPIIFFLIGQMTGLFMLNELILLIAGAILYLLDYALMKNATKRFVPEKLV